MTRRKQTAAAIYLGQPINFGGIICSLGEAIRTMQDEGHDQRVIDAWVIGALSRPYQVKGARG